MVGKGATLALLLLGGFRYLAGAAEAELSRQGFAGLSAASEFALRATAAGACSASELARRLDVSKQAAAKTITSLEERGYLCRADDPNDARRKLLTVTPRGYEAMRVGEKIMDDLRAQWESAIGAAEVARLEADLVKLVGADPVDLSAPGSVAKDTGEAT